MNRLSNRTFHDQKIFICIHNGVNTIMTLLSKVGNSKYIFFFYIFYSNVLLTKYLLSSSGLRARKMLYYGDLPSKDEHFFLFTYVFPFPFHRYILFAFNVWTVNQHYEGASIVNKSYSRFSRMNGGCVQILRFPSIPDALSQLILKC